MVREWLGCPACPTTVGTAGQLADHLKRCPRWASAQRHPSHQPRPRRRRLWRTR